MNVKAAAVAFGLIGLAAAAYGAFGTAVVFGDWLTCQSQGMASLASLPDCRVIPWPRQFGIGATLIIVGVVGMAIAWWLVRRARASRGIRATLTGRARCTVEATHTTADAASMAPTHDPERPQ